MRRRARGAVRRHAVHGPPHRQRVLSRGVFIAIEGIDGAGTSSQARRLLGTLAQRGIKSHLTAEPSGGPIGRLIREQLGQVDSPPDPAGLALLFAADRIHHLQTEIEPLLAQGVHVLSDRYVLSSLAYQSIGLEYDWVASINREARPPDLTLLFVVDPEVSAQRRGVRGGDEEIYDKMQFQRQVAARYEELAGRLSEQNVQRLDANPDFESVAADLEAAVLARISPQKSS